MGKDARQSARNWRRFLGSRARARDAEKRVRGSGTLLFSRKEVGQLAFQFTEWGLYVFLFYGVFYLALTDQMPRLIEVTGPIHYASLSPEPARAVWLDMSLPAAPDHRTPAQDADETFRMATAAERRRCLDVVDMAPFKIRGLDNVSDDFRAGYEAAIEAITRGLEK